MILKRRLSYVAVGSAALWLSACTTGTPAPVVQGGIKQNWLGQGAITQPVPSAASAQTQMAAQATAQPFAQPVVPLLQEEELGQIAPAAGPITRPMQTAPQAAQVTAAPSTETYQVAPQDTLFRIARAHNTTPQAIMQANNLRDMADIQAGRILIIPANTRSSAPSLSESIQAYLKTPPSQQPIPAQPAPVAEATAMQPAISPNIAPKTATAYEMAKIEPAAGVTPPVATASKPAAGALRHKVAAGETIYRISKAYGVSVFDIMAANDLAKPEALQAGIMVNIPASGTVVPAATVTANTGLRPTAELGVTETTRATIAARAAAEAETSATRNYDPDKGTDSAASVQPLKAIKPMTDTERMKAELKRGAVDSAAASQNGIIWPARGQVVKRFGEKGQGVAYTGINIEVPVGTPVLATEAGTVLYADDGLRMYGQMVLIRHTNGMVAAYAHNSHLLVRKGEKVKKGQVVAVSGQSGNASSPQLHFELRRNAVALDPLQVLPKL